MKIREEIQQLSKPEDRPILEWLFNHYHWASQWSFVATFTRLRYGIESYEVHRVWAPTKEGRAIYSMHSGVKCPNAEGAERSKRVLACCCVNSAMGREHFNDLS